MRPAVAACNDLTGRWANAVPTENCVFSAPGVWQLLTALQHVATGDALRELSDATGVAPGDAAAAAAELHEVLLACTGLSTAARVWLREVALLPGALDALPGTDIGDLAGGAAAIDQWVAEHTDGEITELGLQIDSAIRLVLTTAVLAEALWENPFQDDVAFWKDDRNNVIASLERNQQGVEGLDIIQGADGQQASRVVVRTRSGFDVHLLTGSAQATPGEVFGLGLAALNGSATLASARSLRRKARVGAFRIEKVFSVDSSNWVEVSAPAFEVESRHDLLDAAELFGLQSARDATRGHFPGLTGEALAVATAVQAATARFSAKGFKASAATAIGMVMGSIPEARYALRVAHDRPFAFLAVDRTSDLVIFAGWVEQPTAAPPEEPPKLTW